MNGESLISWNFPNFVTVLLMIAVLWVVIGSAGHLLFRKGTASNGKLSTSVVG